MIVTDVGGNAEAVVHAQTGLVVPPRDPKAIGDAIVILARDPEARKRLGAAGRKRVEEQFSIDKCVKAHLDLYQEMLDQAEIEKDRRGIAALVRKHWKAWCFAIPLKTR